MATLGEVRQSLEILHSAGNRQVVMLHCTTNYPCPLDEVNLLALDTMAEALDCLVGYSDHTIGIHVPLLAILKGAVVVEKHFTLDRNLPGPDHRASLEPAELEQMVGLIRQVPILLGSPEKKPTPSEMAIAKIVRKSLVAAQNIQKGQTIRAEMVAAKRPAAGVSPLEIDKVLDRTATRDILKDELLSFDSIE
jgi:sialic acid synthase SpsE